MIEQFEYHRSFMFGLAYRMLGTVSDTEDVLQDAFLRIQNLSVETIRNPKSFLATTVTRLCLNRLSAVRVQREHYVGPWLPEPILTDEASPQLSPTRHSETVDSLSLAFLILLESLSPPERAVFLLHEIFDYKHQEIAEMLDKTVPACRQLLRRAKRQIAEQRSRFKPNPAQHEQFLHSFIQVVEHGEIEAFLDLLADDVTLVPDGGGERGAAIRVMQGVAAVSAFILGTHRLTGIQMHYGIETLNGQRTIVARRPDGRPYFAVFVYGDGQRVTLMHVLAGQKLAHLSAK